ncbi:DUF4157 domain-containing protein [Arenibaculum sp.]|uniref:DUF4157 domain-containing protein n=1 Tax=Arenibaculum sp. TaxID=2865862 RepID=UPI002E120487|nr:DUF4157 domain-containing protein [Arenibaculum sp.]
MTARFRPPPIAPVRGVAQPRMAPSGAGARNGAPPPPAAAAARHFAPPPIAGATGGALRAGIVQGRFVGAPRVAQARGAGAGGRPGALALPDEVRLPAGGGAPLPDGLRTQMETFFKADFSAVRVHVGPQAPAIGALAFTTGTSIFFAPGQYQPTTVQGRMLLGHELAHVVQQRSGRVRNPLGSGIAIVQDGALEAEADRLGRQAALSCPPAHGGGRSVQAATAPGRQLRGAPVVQRMQHNAPFYVPTEQEAPVYYEVRDMRTNNGNVLSDNKVRGNLFEAASKQELESMGLFNAVYDANLIITNCPAVDFICLDFDNQLKFAQCKNHQNAQGYITDIGARGDDAMLFVKKMVSRTLQGVVVAESQRMRQYATTNNIGPLQEFLNSIDQYYNFNPNSNNGNSEYVDKNDAPVKWMRDRIFFPVPEDIALQLPSQYAYCCIILERRTQDFSKMLDLMNYKVTRTSKQVRMDEENDEYRPPGNGL